ncbi:1-acyl-sn-glycerol-3-phosphate acyltransferase LPAT1, chloroplastic-like [Aristolochia californica]|uniref:1-acyl-sn-glycerol-3-phosphate acyltransferase LPAT1, chloroplastic-like n=1 Tax=Aristolochia californica TaxID=171875 RepID=UPI0035DA72A8
METLCISKLSPQLLRTNPKRCIGSSQNPRTFSSSSLGSQRSTSAFYPRPFSELRSSAENMSQCWPTDFLVRVPKQSSIRRNTVVRSELLGTGSPDAAYSLPEFQLASKLRGICFFAVNAIAAIFLFMVMLLAHPFVLLFDPYQRKLHHWVAKIWATLTVKPFFSIEIEGLENLPSSTTAAVYVSNHQSFLDIYALLTLGRSFKFISKTSIFLIPIIGWAMYMLRFIPLRRMDSRSQLECLKRCIDLIKKGTSVFFFPEGTRSKDGKLGTFKKGAFSVAAKTGAPVIPISVLGTGNLMPPGLEGTLNTGAVKVVIHKPIEGSDPDLLCNEAGNLISDALLHGNHRVGHRE